MNDTDRDPEGFVALLAEDALPVGAIRAFTVRDWPVILVRSTVGVHALLNRCSHAGAPLECGRVRGSTIMCPLHGAQFDLASGACRSAASGYSPIRTFPLRIREGMIAVQVPASPPTIDDLPNRL